MPGFNIPFSSNCESEYGFKGNSTYTGPSYNTETARKYRYLLEVLQPLGTKNDGLLLFAYKCTRPSVEIDEIVIHNAQDEIYRPGKHHWKAIELSFYEKLDKFEPPFTDQAAKMIYDWWAKSMINLDTSLHGPLPDYLANAQIDMLDGVGNPIWTYHLYDSWPSRISPSDLSFTDTDIADISITLRYGKAIEINNQR